MYSEITKEAFNHLTHDIKSYKTTESELARKTYYQAFGLTCLIIFNYIGSIEQYYIQDINA